MSITRSQELNDVYAQARDIARASENILNSGHLLLALFTIPNQAAIILRDRKITVDSLLESVDGIVDEPTEIIEKIELRAKRIAVGSNAESVNSLHLLAALIRERKGFAFQLIEESGESIQTIRTAVMSYATGSRKVPEQRESEYENVYITSAQVELNEESAPSAIGIHPSLFKKKSRSKQQVVVQEIHEVLIPNNTPKPKTSTPTPKRVDKETGKNTSGRRPAPTEEPSKQSKNPSFLLKASEISPSVEKEDVSQNHALTEARSTARKLAESLFKKRNEILKKRQEESEHEVEEEDKKLLRKAGPVPLSKLPTEAPLSPARSVEIKSTTKPTSLANAYRLDAEQYPTLVKFGRNVTEEAALGLVDPVVGRQKEINQLIDIIGKRRSNNPILIGEAGVGKTAIVEGLAREFVKLAEADKRMGKRAIIELEIGRLVGGTHLRGAFSERLINLKDEVKQAEGDVIIFLDEIHTWMNAGGGGDGSDASNELKTALARGEFPCIGATTNDEFKKFVEADPAFERRFDVVFVEEPDVETTIQIVTGIRSHYEEHHDVTITDEALENVVKLSQRYIHERRLPDKAIGVLDLAGSRAARTGKDTIDHIDVAKIVAELAAIPPERLTQSDRERFLNMEDHIGKSIIGHDKVVQNVCEVVRRNYAGFRSSRPIGSFLFLGPTGVGKTELVKAVGDFLFHDPEALVRFDMSEFMEPHSISRLIGAPPGYVGFENGGQLTEAIRRRPYQVILFDEIEKAHPDILNLLLQLFDEGRLTDGRGRRVDFSNTCIVMTSNLGSAVFKDASGSRIGFGAATSSKENDNEKAVLEAAKSHFSPELWNRIDERLVFHPLSKTEIAKIAVLQISQTAKQLFDENEVTLVFSDAVIQHLVKNGGFDPELGARPMRQTIQRTIEGSIASMLLTGDATRGDHIFVDVDEFEKLRFTAGE